MSTRLANVLLALVYAVTFTAFIGLMTAGCATEPDANAAAPSGTPAPSPVVDAQPSSRSPIVGTWVEAAVDGQPIAPEAASALAFDALGSVWYTSPILSESGIYGTTGATLTLIWAEITIDGTTTTLPDYRAVACVLVFSDDGEAFTLSSASGSGSAFIYRRAGEVPR